MPSALRRKPLPKPMPQSDPRFRRVMEQLKTGVARTKAHPPASKKAKDAAAAAKGPANERLATGKAKQVDKLKEAKEGKPQPDSFLAMLRAEIAKAMPKTLGETENFDSAADGMKSGLKGNVAQQKEKSTQDVAGASKQAPAPAGEAKVAQPLAKEGAPPSPNVNAPEGMPAPKSDADISLQDSKQDTEQQMKEAEVTPTQLKKANDPRFSAVIEAKDQVAKNADAGPGKYRLAEKATLTSVSAQATARARIGAAAMVGVRNGGNNKVLTRQQEQKAKDEAAREKVTKGIEAIFADTKQRVDAKLAAIDVEVNGMFDSGTEAALAAMKKFVNAKIRDYKIDRYLTIPFVGLARWVRDQFLNLPDEVNVFYEQGRALFQAQMDALIVRVAALVEQRLKEAKAEVARGKQQIQQFVDSQPGDLKKFAMDAQAKVSAGFEELEQGIDNKKNELASSLAQKYKEGFDKANEALKAIQDANKGFVAAFAEKLAAIIKAIMEFKARLSAILSKGKSAIKLIISDPLGFLGNLIDAVKGGISAFRDNITEHLKAGFIRWLVGNMPAGIEIPKDFEPGSILRLVLGVLGITFEKMRAKAVKLLGPSAMTLIETAVKYIKALIEGGPAKLWEEVKDDLSNLKEMVIDAFQSWLIDTIVKKAVQKIVLLFNPAGAIIQAILAIVAIVQFVVQKAMQILDFVEAVVNSIYEIATGAIGSAAKKIEDALAKAIPLLIGFLASLLGLGGVSEKIREFILKVQAKVDKAIDKAIAKVVGVVKKLVGGGKDGKDGGKDGDVVGKIEIPFGMKGTSHTLKMKIGPGQKLRMASEEQPISSKLGAAIAKIKAMEKQEPPPAKGPERVKRLGTLQSQASSIETDAVKPNADAAAIEKSMRKLVSDIRDYARDFEASDVEDILEAKFPAPIVGAYSVLRGIGKQKLADGKIREPHHAPPVQLAKSLSTELVAAGKEMNSETPNAGDDLLTAGQSLSAIAAGTAGTMTAILVHEMTHRKYGGPGGVRIHGSDLIAQLRGVLEKAGFLFGMLTRRSSEKELSPKPGAKAFLRQMSAISQQEAGTSDVRKALRLKTKAIVQKMYKATAAQSFAAVRLAVNASKIDGPAGERSAAVDELESRAVADWENGHLASLQ